jgi:hypothetical protein
MDVVPMDLTAIERDFLTRLALESWASPPLFDHELVARPPATAPRPLGAPAGCAEALAADRVSTAAASSAELPFFPVHSR